MKQTKHLKNPTFWNEARKSLIWIALQRNWKDLATEKNYGPSGFTDEFCQTYKEEKNKNCTPTLSKNRARSECFAHSVHKTTLTPIPKPDKDITRKQDHSNIPQLTQMHKYTWKYKQVKSNNI